jgi:hypothetical protein
MPSESEFYKNPTMMTTFEEEKQITMECPLCEGGKVRIDTPLALYTGKPITISTSTGEICYQAGTALGQCSQCKFPVPIEP